jgi:hypothetical protein
MKRTLCEDALECVPGPHGVRSGKARGSEVWDVANRPTRGATTNGHEETPINPFRTSRPEFAPLRVSWASSRLTVLMGARALKNPTRRLPWCSRGRPPRILSKDARPKAVPNLPEFTADFADGADDEMRPTPSRTFRPFCSGYTRRVLSFFAANLLDGCDNAQKTRRQEASLVWPRLLARWCSGPWGCSGRAPERAVTSVKRSTDGRARRV